MFARVRSRYSQRLKPPVCLGWTSAARSCTEGNILLQNIVESTTISGLLNTASSTRITVSRNVDMQLRLRVILHSALPMFLVISCILMVWKGLCVWLDSPIPIVCVVSESMAPAFHRGDILVISNRQTDIHVGEIPVVWFPSSRLPMVHRAVKTWYTSSG